MNKVYFVTESKEYASELFGEYIANICDDFHLNKECAIAEMEALNAQEEDAHYKVWEFEFSLSIEAIA